MNQEQLRTTLAPPVPELPVEDVERAQQHYRDALGFKIGWLYPGGDIGAVSRPPVAIFFRKRDRPFEPASGYLRRTSTRLTTNSARAVHESLNLSRRSRGVCASSLWKISMETASIFTATDALRPALLALFLRCTFLRARPAQRVRHRAVSLVARVLEDPFFGIRREGH